MADGAELVKLRLTFWHKGKQPGDFVEVRRDELHTWRGFAVPVDETPTPETTTDPGPAKTTTAAAAAGKSKA